MNKPVTIFLIVVAGMILLVRNVCSGFGTIIQKHEINDIPEIQYERIIKLYNPEGTPDKTLAGVVFIKKGASVCTDYPHEVIIKNLDELEAMEKHAYKYFKNYAIKAGDDDFGFVAIAMDYKVNIWDNTNDEDCKYKVQIILPASVKGSTGTGVGTGFGGGGFGGGGGF